jgi:acetyl-CoA carboxylase biotin carboxylase subunit
MMKPIRKVLIANRGEIARRVARTCRRLGIGVVAVYSDADRDMPFVREADEAFRLGPAESAESYLRIDRILEAARVTGADAIHPGYGFLAENAAFATACLSAGVTFIGPTPDAIAAMGSKQRAKRIMADAGVPVIPGYDGADQTTEVLVRMASEVGFPVLVKASAGGGGKGMKRVDREGELAEAIESARREATNAFGDGTLLIEKYVEAPRHVEIQILGDAHGNVVHLNERECSIQRRHQKIVEESPSPALEPDLRRRMGEAAVRAATAIGYRNAGTVEFVLAKDQSFYFLEVNTRLQVEHPVTECVTGLDLVEQQIRVAEGGALGFTQDDVQLTGAAIEVRLYAEDPAAGFLPQTGRIVDFHLPALEGVRVDGGVEVGDEVSIHYDPMVAKIIAYAPDRLTAIRRLRRALAELGIGGLRTNRSFLMRVLDHPAFLAGELDTHFIDDHMTGQLGDAPGDGIVRRAAVLATLHAEARRSAERTVLPAMRSGFRNNRWSPESLELELGDRVVHVEYLVRARDGAYELSVDGEQTVARSLGVTDGAQSVEEAGHIYRGRVVVEGRRIHVLTDGCSLTFEERSRFPIVGAAEQQGACVAPMPGKVVSVEVSVGDIARAGQVLVRMEAMKMEHAVCATTEGTVREIRVSVGEQVTADALLVIVAP